MQEVNLKLFFKLWKKMLDYIMNQICDEKRVVDVVHVEQAQRYGKYWTEDTLNTPRPRHCLDTKSEYNSGMIEWEGLKSFT